MAHFHDLCHGNCTLKYIKGILELRKLDFGSLEGQFDVRKADLRGLIPKIGYLKPILTSRTQLWPIFKDYAMEIVP